MSAEVSYPCKIHSSEDLRVIQLFGDLNYDNFKGFEEYIAKQFLPDSFIAVNLEHATAVHMNWWRWLLKLQTDLKTNGKRLCLMLVRPNLRNELKKAGLDTAFFICANLRDAQVEFGLIKQKMLDTDFINPFLDATLHVLKVQASIDAQPGKVFAKKAGEKASGDISGVIGIVSDTFNGSVVISFPEKTFLLLMSNMLGENYTTLSQEIIDGAGEITNMIFGQAKVVLNDKGYGIKMAIPSVVSGKEHTIQAMSQSPVLVIPFTSNVGGFFVEICISK